MNSYNSIVYEFFGKDKIITAEEFKEFKESKEKDSGSTTWDFVKLANRDGLDTKIYDIEQFGGYRASITDIDNAKAFIITYPTSETNLHAVAMVDPEAKEGFDRREGFHLSNDSNHNQGEVYPVKTSYPPLGAGYGSSQAERNEHEEIQEGVRCTATEALRDYLRRNKITAHEIITFHKRVSAQSKESIAEDFYDKGVEFLDRGCWKEAIKKFDEVITRLWVEKEPVPRELVAKALYNKGGAFYQHDIWKEAIETYTALEKHFGDAIDPDLLDQARRCKDFALSQQAVYGDGVQIGA